MSVTLRKRKNSDGSTSLLLDIYHKGKRSYEFLKELKLSKPSSPADRALNKERLDLAERIANKRSLQLAASDYDMTQDIGKNAIVSEWMQSYIDDYKKKDKRNMQGALNRFKTFLSEKKKPSLTFGSLSPVIISDFQDYLLSRSVGEGASSYFSRFKKMIRRAHIEKVIQTNPASGIKTKGGKPRKKDILTMEEVQMLANTPTESSDVKRAFLFSCMTGLAWVDVSNLRWHNITGNAFNKALNTSRSKTNVDVPINLNRAAIELLGRPGDPNALIFDLPSANGANKTLKAWVKRAGIDKKITWHNARHSFGTNLIYHGADVTTASSLLGHTSLKHTQRYVKTASELKQRATDSLNIKL